MIGSPVFKGHPGGASGQKRSSSSNWLAICGDVHYKSGISLGEMASKPFSEMVETLRGRLEPQTGALAAQDFRHTSQGDQETVADFIRRLERTFAIAYGQDGMSLETRQTLLHGQIQEELRYNQMKVPAVSGAQTYLEFCMAAINEEKGQAELKKWQEYQRPTAASPAPRSFGKTSGLLSQQPQPNKQPTNTASETTSRSSTKR